jgi:gluconokinase
MGSGIPLDDSDRMPWFDVLIAAAKECQARGVTPVLSCSALKQTYRDYLFRDFGDWRLIYLEGTFDLIKARMDARQHEYMTSTLLESQFATLEVPPPHPRLLTLTSEMTPEQWIATFGHWFPGTY